MQYKVVGFVLIGMLISCSTSKLDVQYGVFYPTPTKIEEQLPSTPNDCRDDEALVSGNFCLKSEQKCLRWLDADQSPSANFGIGPLRCAEFERPTKCIGEKRQLARFCIDRYEWPNKFGETPIVTVDWYSAEKSCKQIGKRLCTANEWTWACEGEEMLPYPYGYERDSGACNIDKSSMPPDKPRSEWPKYYLAVPSGSMQRCRSVFGVYDLTGNVDEFVNNVGGKTDGDPYFSGLKGGYWSIVRNRCRPMTTVHGPYHSFYQNGFRCCRDAEKPL